FEHAERLAAMRGPRVYKFSASMNGAGAVRYRVKYRDVGRPDLSSQAGVRGADDGSSGNPAQSRFERVLAAMLGRPESPQKETQNEGRGSRGAARAAWDYSGWRPEDTEKGKRKAYVREDFLGAMDKDRTGRYQGGYLDPDYRDRWIDFHMGGVKPGDPRYDLMYRQTAARWDLVRQQLDQRWSDYGNTVLRGVDAKAAASQGDAAAARAAEVSAQTGVPRAEAAAEAAVDAVKAGGQDAAAAAMGAPVAKESADKKKPKATQGDLGGGVSSQPPEHLILESHVKRPPARLVTGESPALLDRAARIFGPSGRGGAPVLSEGARLEGIFGARPRPPNAERQYTPEEMDRWEGAARGDLRPGEHLTPNGSIVSDMLHRRDNSTFNERRSPLRLLQEMRPRRDGGTGRMGGRL
ncbi:MAG: hypothetical protein J6T17_04145, partial [Clostridia bacterium]|nr:hypothetical protein [Clostridia bacterium]